MTGHAVDLHAEAETSHRRLADLPDREVEGDPHHETQMRFNSPDGSLMARTWTSTPGKWNAFADRDEFCVFLSGHAQLISEDGTVQDLRAGDSFLIPNGFEGFWKCAGNHGQALRHPQLFERLISELPHPSVHPT